MPHIALSEVVKKREIEMAEFLEALKAPQSRRILEKLSIKEMSMDHLIKGTKLSERSVQLHLQPLIRARLVSKNNDGILKLNRLEFKRYSTWFDSISDS